MAVARAGDKQTTAGKGLGRKERLIDHPITREAQARTS